MLHKLQANINGTWRTYLCESLADLEALQDTLAKAGIEYKYVW
jgi:hypothetical protein